MSKKEPATPPEAEGRTPAQRVRDAHTGRGGSYEMKDGKRVLVQRTLTPAEAKEKGNAD